MRVGSDAGLEFGKAMGKCKVLLHFSGGCLFICFRYQVLVTVIDQILRNTKQIVGDNAFYESAMNINNAVLIFMIWVIKHILISMQNFFHNFPSLKKISLNDEYMSYRYDGFCFERKFYVFCCLDLQRNGNAVWSLYPERKTWLNT